jgi:hypothetical protein
MLFLVLFEGKGFLSEVDGRRQRVGFYCNRRVEAPDEENIDPGAAIALIIEELKQKGVLQTPEASVEMQRASEFEPRHEAFEHGFTFYAEESLFRRLLNRFLRKTEP